jgi:hypothetical protein
MSRQDLGTLLSYTLVMTSIAILFLTWRLNRLVSHFKIMIKAMTEQSEAVNKVIEVLNSWMKEVGR